MDYYFKASRIGQPLHPADIGSVGGQLVGVWHNWDHLLVKGADGTELLKWESEEGLIHQARLINQRFLCIALGGGVSVHGVKAYDFEQRRWQETRSPEPGSVEVALLGVHAASSSIFLNTCLHSEAGHGEVWKIEAPSAPWPIAIDSEFECADFIDADSLIACNFQGIFLVNRDGSSRLLYRLEDLVPLHGRADITVIKWQVDDRTILLGDAGGTLSVLPGEGMPGKMRGKILGKFPGEIGRIDHHGRDGLAITTAGHSVHLLNLHDLTQTTLPDAFGLHASAGGFATLSVSSCTLIDLNAT